MQVCVTNAYWLGFRATACTLSSNPSNRKESLTKNDMYFFASRLAESLVRCPHCTSMRNASRPLTRKLSYFVVRIVWHLDALMRRYTLRNRGARASDSRRARWPKCSQIDRESYFPKIRLVKLANSLPTADRRLGLLADFGVNVA